MNSFKKSHSRILTILLVMLLLVSMLAGCKNEDTNPEDNQSTPAPNINLVDTETEPTDSTVPSDATEPLADNIAIVIADQLTVRSGPSEDKNPIGTLDKGTQVEILRTEEVNKTQWALIREGWIPMEFVQMANEAAAPNGTTPEGETKPQEETKPEETPAAQSIKGVISGDGLNIRSEPSTDGDIQGSYSKGEVVTILETKNGWGRTSKGWISMQYVTTEGTNNNTTNNNTDKNQENNTTGTADGTAYSVTVDGLNIRSTNSTNGDIKGNYNAGDRVIITETKDGWGKTDKGWISMTYAYKAGNKGSNPCNGVVIGDQLNVRSGPGTGYNGVGSLNYGARVNVLQRITVGGTTWGCTDKGWICMDYVYIDGTEGEKSGTGTIIGDQLNIRSGPGTGYGSVGSLNKGDVVEILEQIKVGDTVWGCIDKGWISMDYVTMG